MKIFAKEVSIVVISHNRTFFLEILIKSLDNLNFGGHLIIAESSNKSNISLTKKIISKIKKYKISHLSIPKEKGETISQSMNACFKEGIKKIDTKYSMLTCDDDIPVPETLEKFEKFLDLNRNFNGVCGDYVRFYPHSEFDKPFSVFKLLRYIFKNICNFKNLRIKSKLNIRLIPNTNILKNSAKERLDEYIDSIFHTMFVLVRSDTHKRIIPDNYREINFPHFVADYNWMFSIAIAGRIKKFFTPHIIRTFHGKNLSIKNDTHPFPSFADAILEDYWGSDSRKFIKNLASVLSYYDDLNNSEAIDIAKKAYLKITLKRISGDLKFKDKQLSIKKIYNRFEKLKNFITYRLIFFRSCRIHKKVRKELINFYLK